MLWRKSATMSMRTFWPAAAMWWSVRSRIGVLNIRTRIDVDTITGLKATEGVLALKDKYKGVVDMQTVAFPQEGIMRSDPGADKLMWQAMEMGCWM